MPRRSPRLAVAAVLLALTAAAGCAATGPTSAAACDTPGITPDQVDLGLTYPDTGVLAPTFSAARAGIDARLGQANEAGGVHGRKIVYEVRDDQGTVEANRNATRELVDQRHVFGLLEPTVVTAGGASYLAEQNIPVTGIAAEDVWAKYSNMFAFAYPTIGTVDTYGKFIRSRGGHSFALFQTGLSSGVSDAGAKYVRSLEAAGLRLAGVVNYTPNTDGPEAVAREIIATGADSLMAVVQPADLVKVLNQVRADGTDFKAVISASGYDSQLLHTYGTGMTGIAIPVFYHPFETGGPPIATYLSAMARFAPQVERPEQDIAIMSYIAADMFVRGLQVAGPCPTWDGFVHGLRSVRSYDAGGLIQPVDLQNGLGRPVTCYSFVEANGAGTAFDVAEQDLCGAVVAP